MCPLGYQEGQAGLAAGLLILAGLIGSFILGPLARRYSSQVATPKVAMPLAAIFGIGLAESLRFPDFYPGILVSLMGFGFWEASLSYSSWQLRYTDIRYLTRDAQFN